MKLIVKNNQEIIESISQRIIDLLKEETLITLASGDTVVDIFSAVVTKYKENPFVIKATLVNLDEWVGLDKDDIGSCQYNMFKDLFTPLQIPETNLIYFDAKANDLESECKRIDDKIGNRIFDYVLLGVGMNGHLALNEPGCSFDTKAFYTDLDEITKEVMKKYFPSEVHIEKGISLGMKYFLESKELVVVATGARKHSIIQKVIASEVTSEIPATIIKQHSNSTLIIDDACHNNLT